MPRCASTRAKPRSRSFSLAAPLYQITAGWDGLAGMTSVLKRHTLYELYILRPERNLHWLSARFRCIWIGGASPDCPNYFAHGSVTL